jgi:predicted ester cyclase
LTDVPRGERSDVPGGERSQLPDGSPAAVVRRLVDDVWNAARPQTAYDVVGQDLPGLDTVGPEGTLAWHEDRRSSFPDLVYTVTRLVAECEQVAFAWEAKGTQRGAFGPVPPTGRSVHYRGMTCCRVVDGRVVEVSSVNDLFGLLEQLGVEVTPPSV